MAEADVLKLDRAPVPPPTGRVVLGFTDVQGSTELWETDQDAMREGLALQRKTRDTYVWQVEWSPDGTILAAAGWSGPPYLWPGDDATALAWARDLVSPPD